MEKIMVITDSASDMSAGGRDNLMIVPMTVRFGDTEYQDGVNIGHREFYEKLIESDELPVTSLIPPGDFEAAYEKALSSCDSVVVVTISGKLSGTNQSARLAAEGFEGRVWVVDSMNAAIGEQILVEYALRLASSDMPAGEIAAELERARGRIHLIALLDTLEYLKKGGRISPTVAFMGGVLSIKPVITISDGQVEMLGKARGSRNGNNFLIKDIESGSGVDFDMPFTLGYTGLDDSLLRKYIEDSRQLWEGHTEHLPVSPIGSTIGTHVGPNAIAVAFFMK